MNIKDELKAHKHKEFSTIGVIPNIGSASGYDGYPIIIFNPVEGGKYNFYRCKFGYSSIESFSQSVGFLTRDYRKTDKFKEFADKIKSGIEVDKDSDEFETFKIILDFTNLTKCELLINRFDIEPSEIFAFTSTLYLYSKYSNIEFIPIFPDWIYIDDSNGARNGLIQCFNEIQDIHEHEQYFGVSLFKVWHFETKNTTLSDIWNIDGVWERLRKEIFESFPLKKGWMDVLEWVFGEILDNSYTHAKSNNIFFQIVSHPVSGDIQLFVSDDGYGFLNSFKYSTYSRTMKTEIDAITMALRQGVTSNEKNNAGWGLYGTSQIIRNTAGELNIQSGKTKMYHSSKNLFVKNFNRYTRPFGHIRKGTSLEIFLPVNVSDIDPSEVAGFNTISTFWDKFEYDENLININSNNSAIFYAHEQFQGFGSRESGKLAYNITSNLLNNYDELTVDFSKVPVVSASFSDECFAKLCDEFSSKNKLFLDEESININLNYYGDDKKIKLLNMEIFVKNILLKTIQQRIDKNS